MSAGTSMRSRGARRWRATTALLITAAAGLGGDGPAPHAAAGTTTARSFTAYVVNSDSNTVTPINTATGTPGRPIPVGEAPEAIAIRPNGKTAYVVNFGSDKVTPSRPPATPLAGRSWSEVIPSDNDPNAIAITPNGKTAYVLNSRCGTPSSRSRTATNARGQRSPPRTGPFVIAITPNGRTAYVANQGSGTVTPIAHGHQHRRAAGSGQGPTRSEIAITPDGKTAYVGNAHLPAPSPRSATATNTPGHGSPLAAPRPQSRSRLTARPPTSRTPPTLVR